MQRLDAVPRVVGAFRDVAGGPAPLTPRDTSKQKKQGRLAAMHAGGAA